MGTEHDEAFTRNLSGSDTRRYKSWRASHRRGWKMRVIGRPGNLSLAAPIDEGAFDL
jgi:hypothetical protein